MSGFLQKLRVVTLASVHDLLDKKLEDMGPSALRQTVRDLEDALAKMKSEAVIQGGEVRTQTREVGDLDAKITSGKASMQKCVDKGDVASLASARQTGALVVTWQRQLEQKKHDLDLQKTASANLDLAVQKLDMKHTDAVTHLREVESLDRNTKFKEQSASTLDSIQRLTESGVSVDNLEDKMRARADAADEHYERAMASSSVAEDPSASSEVDDLLASMKPQPEKQSA
jgi:PspA/IM30 family protein